MSVKIKASQVTHGADWDQTTITEIEIDPVDVEISECEKLRAKAEHYRLMFEQQQARVIDMLEARDEKTHISALDGGRQVTVVAGETVSYDFEGMAKVLSPAQAELVTVRKVDRHKLERAVLDGIVPPEVVADFAEVKPRKPFLRISEHRESEPEG